jgi:ATP-dependent Clp protease ATP-binding subunit ClpA
MGKIKIVYGPKNFFKKILEDEGLTSEKYEHFSQLVIESGIQRLVLEQPKQNEQSELPKKEATIRQIQNLVIESGEYSSANEHVLINYQIILGKYDIENMFVHNPPDTFKESITGLFNPNMIEERGFDYKLIAEDEIRLIDEEFDKNIFGQNDAKENILISFTHLLSSNKPVVLLFYGPSGVGKTETAKLLARLLEGAENTLFRRQLSMFQNTHFTSYLFGGVHNENSFSRELLSRSSNIILIDEFDKVEPIFHNAFYQLFDEGLFVDSNYTVNLKKSIIICTSNYPSEESARAQLGDPIYSRFDACIGFKELSSDAKKCIVEKVVMEEIDKLPETARPKVNVERVKEASHYQAKSYGNYRMIRSFIRDLVATYRLEDIRANKKEGDKSNYE